MYYTSPRFFINKEYSLTVGSQEILRLDFPYHASPKIYYEISCNSMNPANITITFKDKNGNLVGTIFLKKKSGLSYNNGMKILDSEPSYLEVSITGDKDDVASGFLNIRYSSIDYEYYTKLMILQILASIISIILLAFGIQNYIIKPRIKSDKDRL